MGLLERLKLGSTPAQDDLSWEDVPAAVSRWYAASAPGLCKLAGEKASSSGWFDVRAGAVSPFRTDTCVRFEKAADGVTLLPEPLHQGIGGAAEGAGQAPVMTDSFGSGPGSALSSVFSLKRNPANNLFGGPTPLATSITGSALGAGLGYLGGRIAENLLPQHFQGKRLRRTLALAGAGLGAAPGLYLGRLGAKADGTSYGEGLITPGVLSNEKQADAGLFGPSIEVDMFNRLVMSDPFTPPAVRAATTALASAADRSTGGGGVISVSDLARVAIGAGAGYLQAYAGAKILGGLAGLDPSAQKALQRTGFVAGALNAAVPKLFGGN